ncbi:hypothetical protein EM864_00345 [Stenotrophomonas acidaminiphila]|uniref:hypothetical protein n=1 Tax=Stenotrophomonas acidaminiphila TaxID=128780 RepID=UPI0024068904|nr:hypothetical protein [Stenotrophomonas acidaminiphila]MDF9440199.1 hypothetical protein [Stenotrophomonas acidaminiphila]
MSTAIVGLIGVILGSILAGLKDWLVHVFKRRSDGRYAAVMTIAVLEEYLQKCVAVVADDGTCEGRPAGRTDQGEEYLAPQAKKPEPPIYPADVDWRSISFKLMYKILSLPNAARETDRYIAASAEHSFPPDYDEFFAARQEGYAHLGLQAFGLIEGLREEFRLPATNSKFWDWGWSAEKFFQEKLDELQKHRRNDVIADKKVAADSGRE